MLIPLLVSGVESNVNVMIVFMLFRVGVCFESSKSHECIESYHRYWCCSCSESNALFDYCSLCVLSVMMLRVLLMLKRPPPHSKVK